MLRLCSDVYEIKAMTLRLWSDVYGIEAMRLRLWSDVYRKEAMRLGLWSLCNRGHEIIRLWSYVHEIETVRHVTGTGLGFLRKSPEVVFRCLLLLKGPL